MIDEPVEDALPCILTLKLKDQAGEVTCSVPGENRKGTVNTRMPCSLLQALTSSEPLWVQLVETPKALVGVYTIGLPQPLFFPLFLQKTSRCPGGASTLQLAAESSQVSVPGSAEQLQTTPLTSQHLILLFWQERSPRL